MTILTAQPGALSPTTSPPSDRTVRRIDTAIITLAARPTPANGSHALTLNRSSENRAKLRLADRFLLRRSPFHCTLANRARAFFSSADTNSRFFAALGSIRHKPQGSQQDTRCDKSSSASPNRARAGLRFPARKVDDRYPNSLPNPNDQSPQCAALMIIG
jgi:hypothetical protein